jgi:hypothetical protein
MGEVDKSFVRDEIFDGYLFDTQNEGAISDIFIDDGPSALVFPIREHAFLRWLNFDAQMPMLLQNFFHLLRD